MELLLAIIACTLVGMTIDLAGSPKRKGGAGIALLFLLVVYMALPVLQPEWALETREWITVANDLFMMSSEDLEAAVDKPVVLSSGL